MDSPHSPDTIYHGPSFGASHYLQYSSELKQQAYCHHYCNHVLHWRPVFFDESEDGGVSGSRCDVSKYHFAQFIPR